LEALQKKGALDPNVSKEIADLYGELNGAIHSAEAKMLHSGLRDGEWAGLQFKAGDFREWCTYVSRVVTVSISLLLAMLQEMQRQPAPNGIVCDVCRAVNRFAFEERNQFGVTLRCLRCGHRANFDSEYAARFGFF
jgi:hypothetical protein